jgi:hypothetical protein
MAEWWYVMVVCLFKNPIPTFKHRVKWHLITLLSGIRYSNVLPKAQKKEALTEAVEQ